MVRTKKEPKIEEPKELTDAEKLEIVLAHYGKFNRHERRKWSKLLGVPGIIKGLNIPHKKGEYKAELKKTPENALCKNSEFVENKKTKEITNKGCKNLRANGSSRCYECKTNKA